MSSEILAITEHDETYMIVAPEHGLLFEVYDPAQGSKDILVVRCLKHDQGSDIFLFPQPEGVSMDDMEEDEFLDYCTEENFATQVDHETGCHVDMYNHQKEPIELVIGHNLIMAIN